MLFTRPRCRLTRASARALLLYALKNILLGISPLDRLFIFATEFLCSCMASGSGAKICMQVLYIIIYVQDCSTLSAR